ncbi:MAG TPA: RNA-binding S4 domain-containing protein [Puia sp.]|nr:RNA-binding S4 domain-containing protein [Puia sp.]
MTEPSKEKLRLDKYLWAIRMFKTRALATEACNRGKIKFNAAQVKPSKQVHLGEEYDLKTETRRWRIKVAGLLDHRVQYNLAVNYYLDITPSEELERFQHQAASFHTGKRQSKIGRPTKKQRRDLNDFLEE